MDRLTFLYVLAQDVDDGRNLVLALRDERVDTLLEVCQSLGNGGVQHYQCRCTVGLRAYRTELEAVSGERKR